MENCYHLSPCDEFLDHTADMLVRLGQIMYPGDPVRAAEAALAGAGCRPPERPMDTSDIDPDTGEEWGVGPDYDRETETAEAASQELTEQEAGEQ